MRTLRIINKWVGIACLTVTMGITGCNTEPELTDRYGEEVAWSSEKNLNLYVNKFYPIVGGYYSGAVDMDCYTDIMKANTPTDECNLLAFGQTTISPDANRIGGWEWAYSWIRSCNEFLEGLAEYGGNLDEAVTKRAEAEVRFFRAYMYFDLAKKFNAQVILLDKLPTSKENARCEDPNQCWDFIVKDLDFAAENLPHPNKIVYADKGKLTKGAALALKAKAMLYAKRWKAASDAAKEVMDLNYYELYPDYEALFKIKRANESATMANKEAIVEFGYTSPDFGYSFDYFNCPPGDKGYAEKSPTEDLVSTYQMADGTDFSWNNAEHAANPYVGREKRFYASILYNGADWKGRKIETFVGGVDGYGIGGATTCTGYYMKKLFDEGQRGGFVAGDLTFYFMRYAEVLLIYSEAMAEQNNLPEALRTLNMVRQRAGFTQDLSTTSKSEFMSWLRRENMLEFAFEGHRYWDLRRWGLATSVLNGTHCTGTKITKNDDGTFTYEQVDCDGGKVRFYPEKYNCFPIPLTEIQRNPACKQFEQWK